jgi:hypothetical protein
LNPEIQYVYHCTTHVPYNTAYTNAKPFSVRKHPERNEDRERELTLTTTANTMGPKTMFTFISMLPTSLDNKSTRVRERGFLASGGWGRGGDWREIQGEGGRERDLGVVQG